MLIVKSSLDWIAEDLVGLRYLWEVMMGCILILFSEFRMPSQHWFTIALCDLLISGISPDPKYLIIVSIHGFWNLFWIIKWNNKKINTKNIQSYTDLIKVNLCFFHILGEPPLKVFIVLRKNNLVQFSLHLFVPQKYLHYRSFFVLSKLLALQVRHCALRFSSGLHLLHALLKYSLQWRFIEGALIDCMEPFRAAGFFWLFLSRHV